MTTKQSVFIATSVDGYIARTDGDIDWLSEYEPEAREDYGFYRSLLPINRDLVLIKKI